jgi:hypothetical protein
MPLPVRQRDSARARPQARPAQRFEPFRELEEIQQHLNELLSSTFPQAPGDEVVRPWVPPVPEEARPRRIEIAGDNGGDPR